MLFYICFALALIAGLLSGLSILTGSFPFCLTLPVLTGGAWVGFSTNPLVLEFLFGSWLAYAVLRWRMLGHSSAIGLVLLARALFAAGMVAGVQTPALLVWGVPAFALVAGFVYWERGGRLPNPVLRLSFLGDSSYLLYLVHILLIDMLLATPLLSIARSAATGLLLCVIVTAICCALSVLFYNVFEKRMLRFLQRWLLPKRTAEPKPQAA